MEFLYFAVKGSSAWTSSFHNNFFNTCGGFAMGLVGAVVIGLVIAVAFYFLLCNSRTSAKFATLPVWVGALVVAGILGYVFANNVVIGTPKVKSGIFYNYSFYDANEKYYIAQTQKGTLSETAMNDLIQKKQEIRNNLDKGRDVRVPFSATTAVYTLIVFFLTSLLIKRVTINGKGIPFLKP